MTNDKTEGTPRYGLGARSITRRDALRALMAAAGLAAAAPATRALASQYSASQQTLDALSDAQSQADEVERQLDALSDEYEGIASQLSGTMDSIDSVNSQIADIESQVSDLEDQIADKQDEIDASEKEIAQKREALGARMSSAYKQGAGSILDILLSSSSFEELTSNIYYLDKVSSSDRAMIDEVKRLQDKLNADKESLEKDKSSLEDKKSSLEEQRSDLEELKDEQQAQADAAQAKQDEVSKLLDSLNDDVASLIAQRDSEIFAARKEAEAEAARRAAQQKGSTSGGSTSGGSTSGGSKSGGSTSGGSTSGGSTSGGGSAQAVINACYRTGSTGVGMCAAWVTNVFRNAGIGSFYGNACDMYAAWCYSSDQSALRPGMIVAVPTCLGSYASRVYGHVGIYIGGGMVYQNLSGVVGAESLSAWIANHGSIATTRWGWLGGVALS